MTVLSIDGKPAVSALDKTERDHNPERVMRRRQQLAKVLAELREGWMKDNGEDPVGATRPIPDAIDRHYDERWREQARVANNAQEAVDADPEAMATWMAAQREAMAKADRWQTPFHKLHDLEEFQFRLAGKVGGGDLWLCSHVALHVFENGQVKVYTVARHLLTDPGIWDHVLPAMREPTTGPCCIVDAIDYTPQELFALLGAMRVDKITFPTEDQMDRARQ